jgi:sporulation protein YlmC with PRC-barrel domain
MEVHMPTPSGHTTAISVSKVTGTDVYNTQGEHIGHVEDVVLDKTSNNVMFVILGFGGFLGIGEKFHAMPWSMLDYEKERGGYVVNLDKKTLQEAPVYDIDDLIAGDGAAKAPSLDYYSRFN